ncbi:hypothetical protein SH501x_001335 [Pirellulaceae bacterium SH501]
MPRFFDVDFRCNHTRENDSADLVVCDRFDGDSKATTMFAIGGFHTLNRRITDESS